MNIFSLILMFSILVSSFVIGNASPGFSYEMVLPAEKGVVSDYFDVVDPETRQRIESLTKELRRITSVNLQVAIIRSTKPINPEIYGRGLYDLWNVGLREEKLDRGVLILIAVLDREVKLIIGKGADFLFTKRSKEDLEMSMYPYLGEGKIAEAAYYGAAKVNGYILSEWRKYDRFGSKIDMETMSRIIFGLTVAGILLSLVFGGTYLTAFATIVGGIFGYLYLGVAGMVFGAAIGFVLNINLDRFVKK